MAASSAQLFWYTEGKGVFSITKCANGLGEAVVAELARRGEREKDEDFRQIDGEDRKTIESFFE